MKHSTIQYSKLLAGIAVLFTLLSCARVEPVAPANSFTIAVIPDTQNMVSYKHQTAEGFAIDGGAQFQEQMETIASWKDDQSKALAFVVGVGDVWQHQSKAMDEDHIARGFTAASNPFLEQELPVTLRVISEEIPRAIKGYSALVDAKIPFGVAPGNHDHDAMWNDSNFPPNFKLPPSEMRIIPEHVGMLHIGGLDNFRSAFGDDSAFYAGKPWYIEGHNGGASSAQTFQAGGYTFLHIALEMQPSDEVIKWALSVIDEHPGTPTLISTHDYLNTEGERLPNPVVDLARIDPDQHNNAEQLWEKLLSQRDEVFLVLSGHQHAQSRRVDNNINGFKVHQVLADYQSRGQSGLDAGQKMHPLSKKPEGIGDGWFRLMEFDFNADLPLIRVKTYSSHYKAFSGDMPKYAEWYRKYEHPDMNVEEFKETDDFILELTDFKERFVRNEP